MKESKIFKIVTNEIFENKEQILYYNFLVELFTNNGYYIIKQGIDIDKKYFWEFSL